MNPAVEFWDSRRGTIRTRKGGWVVGQGAYSHGYSILEELLGHASFFQVLILNLTGRLPEPRLAQWCEATFLCLSWPDPRLWCNHIGALGGTLRASPVASVCAGVLGADSQMYGPGTAYATVDFLEEARRQEGAGLSIAEIVAGRHRSGSAHLHLPGYSRPLAKGDERVEAMQGYAETLGFPVGAYLDLAYRIQEYLVDHYGEGLNLAGYLCAFLLDQGFTGKEIYRLYSLCVNSGVHGCYAETADAPAESFLPMRCEDIEYIGAPERQLPEDT
jgi:citrate synthase